MSREGLVLVLGHTTGARFATATDRVIDAASDLACELRRKRLVATCRRQGWAFEALHQVQFERAAARARVPVSGVWTHVTDHGSPVDLFLQHTATGEHLLSAQAKSYGTPQATARALRDERYAGLVGLVPADQYEAIRVCAPDLEARLADELRHGDVTSGGVTRRQAEFAADHPRLLAVKLIAVEMGREVGAAALAGGAGAAAFSAVPAIVRLTQARELSPGAGRRVAADAWCAGWRGAALAGTARAVAIGLRRAGLPVLAKGALPGAVAHVTIVGISGVARVRRGEVTTRALGVDVANAGASVAVTTACGVAGQALVPVPLVGAGLGFGMGVVLERVLRDSGYLGGVSPAARERQRRAARRRELNARLDRRAVLRAQLEQVHAARLSPPPLEQIGGALRAGLYADAARLANPSSARDTFAREMEAGIAVI